MNQDLVSKRKKNVMKSMIYVLKQKKGATLTTTREKKHNKNNDLGEKGGTVTTTQEKNYNKINDLRKIGGTVTTTRDFYPHPYYYI